MTLLGWVIIIVGVALVLGIGLAFLELGGNGVAHGGQRLTIDFWRTPTPMYKPPPEPPNMGAYGE